MKVKYCEEFNLSSYNPSKPEKQAKQLQYFKLNLMIMMKKVR